jgi:DNA-binding HxlR family transcriptional regulator
MELVGRKWTLHVVEDLLNGPRRFGEIERSIRDANSKLITVRLRELEAAGLVTRTIYAEVPPRVEYALTKKGRELRPAIAALRRFGSRVQPHSRPSRRPSQTRSRSPSRTNASGNR